MTSIRQRINRGLSAIRPHMPVLAVAVLLVAALVVPASVFAGGIVANDVVNDALGNFISPIWNIAQMGIALACVVLAIVKAFQAARGQHGLWTQAILLFVVAIIVTMPATFAGIFNDDLEQCVMMLERGSGSCNILR